jgi:hypothetical protein
MRSSAEKRILGWVFAAAAVLAVFTGFGNMPLYRRYYISDLPGLAWAGDFIANLQVHYVAGAVVLALAVYTGTGFLLRGSGGGRITRLGAVRTGALALTLITGVMMALRNMPGVDYPFGLHLGMNFFHMGMALLFAALSLAIRFLGRRRVAAAKSTQ